MELIEHEVEERLDRETAAQRLRELADELSRHNEVPFVKDEVRFSVKVPDEVTYSLEIEVDEDGSEVEIELSW